MKEANQTKNVLSILWLGLFSQSMLLKLYVLYWLHSQYKILFPLFNVNVLRSKQVNLYGRAQQRTFFFFIRMTWNPLQTGFSVIDRFDTVVFTIHNFNFNFPAGNYLRLMTKIIFFYRHWSMWNKQNQKLNYCYCF